MNISPVIGVAAAVAVVLSLSAVAQSGPQGTVTEVQDGGRKIVLKTAQGRIATVAISDSHTRIIIDGKEGSGEAILPGMTCIATTSSGDEATSLACT